MLKNVRKPKHCTSDSIRSNGFFSLNPFLCSLVCVFFASCHLVILSEAKPVPIKAINDEHDIFGRFKRAAIKPSSKEEIPYLVNETRPDDIERHYKLFGWPVDERMLKRLEVFVTRKFEDFMSKYYDPKGFHGQETHPIYGKFGTRFITREPLSRTDPYNKVVTKVWTRPANHTYAFATDYPFTNQTPNPEDKNTGMKLYGWPLEERNYKKLEVFVSRKFEDFMSKYYDPKGFHGQETHPIYGKFGTRLITREPWTRTEPYNKIITKLWTRPANYTFRFSVRTFDPNEPKEELEYVDQMTERPKIPRKRPRNGTRSPQNELTKLYGWPIDKLMHKRLEVFITRKFEEFMSRYYDPKGFHGQETHPIYGKFGTRFITREPFTRTDPYNKIVTKVWTRPANHTYAFATDYPFTNQTPNPEDKNTGMKLYGWPLEERNYKKLEVFVSRKFDDFMSKYYDPKGFHGQETHPIYGKFGTRLITREPWTRTEPYNKVITKLWTRAPNYTYPFSFKTYTTPEFGYYDESEIDDRVIREFEEDRKKKLAISQQAGIKNGLGPNKPKPTKRG